MRSLLALLPFLALVEPPPRRRSDPEPELAVTCPRGDCRAAPGEPCNPRTLVRHRFHKDRVDAARQAK